MTFFQGESSRVTLLTLRGDLGLGIAYGYFWLVFVEFSSRICSCQFVPQVRGSIVQVAVAAGRDTIIHFPEGRS